MNPRRGNLPGGETADANVAREAAMLTWIQEIAPYGVLTTDLDLRIRSWNQWLTAHSGLDAEAVIGQPLFEVYPELRQRRLDEHFHRALGGEVSVLATALHRYLIPLPPSARDCGYTHMLQTARIAPLVADRVVLGTVSIIEDVTHRERQATLLRREHEHDALLSWALARLLQCQELPADIDAIYPRVAEALGLELYCNYMLDGDGSVLRLHASGGSVDPARLPPEIRAEDGLCGRCARTRAPVVIGRLQLSDEPAAAVARGLGMRAFAGFPLAVGDRLLGTLAFATATRDAIAPGDVEFLATLAQYVAIAIERGVRERALREAQAALSRHAETLELKIAERTLRLNETIAQLESFSYTVAHDLRAPIRALSGYCDILLTDYAAQFPDAARTMVQRLGRASSRLDALTRDLLRFSKVSREDLDLAVVPVRELVDEIVIVTPALQGVVTINGPLGDVWAQRTLLQQCLSNLLDNAVKFVPAGTRPRIVIQAERRESASVSPPRANHFGPHSLGMATGTSAPFPPPPGARVRISVIDNGMGIPPEAHQRIFGMFERAIGAAGVEGTGIGLAIVERATQRMGGACGVESEPGRGSQFWIELVASDAPRPCGLGAPAR